MARYNDFTIAELFRQRGARVGHDCRLLIRELGPEPYLIEIGNHVTVSGDVSLLTHDGGGWIFTDDMPSLQSFGPIRILDNCFIGARAILLPGVTVGPNSIVGTGAVVTEDVPPDTIVAGVPAKPISATADYKRKLLERWERQKPPGFMAEIAQGSRHSAAEIMASKMRHKQLLRRHLEHLFFNR